MLNVLVLMEDPKNMQELINKIVKINNKIYQNKPTEETLGRSQ